MEFEMAFERCYYCGTVLTHAECLESLSALIQLAKLYVQTDPAGWVARHEVICTGCMERMRVWNFHVANPAVTESPAD